MPNWKKVITSGSNAHLNHITASGKIKSTGNIHSDNRVTGNELAGTIITAAQTNITSLGTLSTLTVDDITINGSEISDGGAMTIEAGGNMSLQTTANDIFISPAGKDVSLTDGSGTAEFIFNLEDAPELDVDGDFTIDGSGLIKLDSATERIEAVGNITASGDISASGNLNSNKLLLNNTNGNDNLEGTSEGVTYKSNNHKFIGHITASANISGSSTSNITIGGDFKGITEDSQLLIGHQTAGNFTKAQISEHSDGVTPVAMDFLKSRGTLASPTTVARGDFTGTQRYYGHDGSSYRLSAAIRGDIDSGATVGTNVMPGALNFLTTTNGALNSRMFIASTGNIGIGVGNTNTGPAAKLDVDGNIQTTSHITASGNISSSGTITANSYGDVDATSVTVSGNINANGNIVGDDSTDITNINSISLDAIKSDATSDVNIAFDSTKMVFESPAGTKFVGNITASGNISSSGTITMLTASIGGGIFTSASLAAGGGGGAVSAVANGSNNRVATFSSGDALNGESNLTFDGSTLGVTGNQTISSHITASGNISSSGAGGFIGTKLNLTDNNNSTIIFNGDSALLAVGKSDTKLTLGGGGDWTNVQIARAPGQPKRIQIYGPITASHPISASGTSTVTNLNVVSAASTIKIGENVAGNFDGIAVQGVITSSGNLILHGDINARDITDVTNITASGNISASGYGDGGILEINRNSNEATIGVDTAKAVGNSAFHLNVDGINKITMKKDHLETIVRSDIAVGDGVSTIIMESASGDLQLTGSGKLYGSSSYLTIANDGTAPSELRLNCEANSHYIGIRGPVHSGASSYVLKLPNSAPSDNQILKVNGSPSNGEVTLAWEADADSGGGGGVSFPTTTVISSSTDLFIGKTDGAFLSASTGNVEISGSGRGQLEVDYRLFDTGSSHLSSAGGGVGDIVKFGGSSTQAGDIYYLQPAGTWAQARANAVSTSTGSLAVALGSNSTTDGMLLKGMVKLHNDPSATIGNPVFLDDTAAGHARNDAPDDGGDIVRIVGYYYGSGGLIYFNPDNTFIEVAS